MSVRLLPAQESILLGVAQKRKNMNSIPNVAFKNYLYLVDEGLLHFDAANNQFYLSQNGKRVVWYMNQR